MIDMIDKIEGNRVYGMDVGDYISVMIETCIWPNLHTDKYQQISVLIPLI